jgi:hypothetical protein
MYSEERGSNMNCEEIFFEVIFFSKGFFHPIALKIMINNKPLFLRDGIGTSPYAINMFKTYSDMMYKFLPHHWTTLILE